MSSLSRALNTVSRRHWEKEDATLGTQIALRSLLPWIDRAQLHGATQFIEVHSDSVIPNSEVGTEIIGFGDDAYIIGLSGYEMINHVRQRSLQEYPKSRIDSMSAAALGVFLRCSIV